jgi:ferritin
MLNDTTTPGAVEAIDAAAEQLVLVEGVLREALDHEDRIRKALQALSNARADLDVAIRLAKRAAERI